GASATKGFDQGLKMIETRYPVGIAKLLNGVPDNDYVWSYLCKIHPTDSSLVGNMQPTLEDLKWRDSVWKNTPTHGEPLPLFGVRTTSAVEGDNNGLLWCRSRNKLVLGSLMAYCSRALSVIQKRKIVVSEWIKPGNDATPHAMKLFNTEKLLVARQTDVVGDERILYVFNAFDSRSSTSKNAHAYEVNMDTGRSKYKDAGVAQYDVRKYFHSAYL
ncbi:hypothetical protein L914_10247, partial [Phytophthora nicotianae]